MPEARPPAETLATSGPNSPDSLLEQDSAPDTRPSPARPPRRICLALQGGGSHGAFTWGALDTLLQDGRLDISGLSGTSAGAMNAVVLACGYATGGRDGARALLSEFWRRIGELGRLSPLQRTPWAKATGSWRVDDNPAYAVLNVGNVFSSPYQSNPLNLHPLRGILADVVDFPTVRRGPLPLFLSATDVETGQVKVFRREETCIEVVLASACLPSLFQAVRFQGHHYWDGGFMGNPVLQPLYGETGCSDVLLIRLNPVERPGVPKNPFEIGDRLNEITFNASLLAETQMINRLNRLHARGVLPPDEWTPVRLHEVAADDQMRQVHASSKLSADPDFLEFLYELGCARARGWLDRDWPSVGRDSTAELVARYA